MSPLHMLPCFTVFTDLYLSNDMVLQAVLLLVIGIIIIIQQLSIAYIIVKKL